MPVILPWHRSGVVAYRLAALKPHFSAELYELESALGTLERIDPRQVGSLNFWLVPQREAENFIQQARSAMEPVIAIAPKAITIHPVSHSREVWLRFRGLPFARWQDGRIFFWAAGRA